MKTLTIIFVTLISCQFVIGQKINNGLIGKVLVDSEFEFIEIINDSLIYSSLNNFIDTAVFEIIENYLVIKEKLYEPNTPLGFSVERFKYYITKQTDSTLILISPHNFRLDFQDIHFLPNEITDFEYLELEYLTPWSHDRLIRIDNQGNYYDRITYSPLKSQRLLRKHKIFKEKLNDEEILTLKQKLTEFYAIYLPIERGCPIDGELSNFVIKTNGQTIESKGCDLSWIHTKLLNYILNIKTIND